MIRFGGEMERRFVLTSMPHFVASGSKPTGSGDLRPERSTDVTRAGTMAFWSPRRSHQWADWFCCQS